MNNNFKKLHASAVSIRPVYFPIIGLITGLSIWFADALVDVYILGEDDSLLENILAVGELTELWMRTLVLIVFILMGFFSRHVLQKHIELDETLLKYQDTLEEIIEERTRELTKKSKEFETLASLDPLTGLYNRRKFSEILNYELNRFFRYKTRFSLINIDIDYFKKVNDTYGHDVGDIVIKRFCEVLKENIRSVDSAARWGGEEFLLLIVESDVNIAKKISAKINDVLFNTDFSPVEKVTVSIGITQVVDGDTNESVITRSDRALYKAKNNGRNRIEIE